MRRSLLLLLALCLVLFPLAATALPSMTADPPAVTAPDDGTAEHVKAAGNGKLSTDLVRLIDPAARLPGQTRGDVARSLHGRNAYRVRAADGVGEVYVYVSLEGAGGTERVDPFARVVARDEAHGLVSAWVSEDRLLTLAAQPFVRSVRPVLPPVVDRGSVTTEGDGLLNATAFRAATGHSGAGIRVGVISDGVDSWTQARDTGDLPADLHVLANTQGGDEGTAMCEIIHDIAPGASLYFHDNGPDDRILFKNAIAALAGAGCRVIVDDISWYEEPAFEDGIIAQEIDALVASPGIVYVGSAGNYANLHYQGPFHDQGGALAGWHDFSNGADTQNRLLYLNISPGGNVTVALQWDDRWGQSSSDYDLYLTRFSGGATVASSENLQNGGDDPLEILEYTNTGTSAEIFAIKVRKFSGQARTLEVFVIPRSGASTYSDNLVAADSIAGNHAAAGEIAVAAAGVASPGMLEGFSSRGPATIRWPAPEVRQKPDITGPDGSLISGAGDWGYRDGDRYRFYGTSASAPHVAALAALAWSGRPAATGGEVRTALLETAQDRGPAGFDGGWGRGWPDVAAFAARLGVVRAVPPGSVPPTDTNGDGKYEDVNGNNRKDFADVVLYFNQMTWIAANEPISAFDCNGNGRIDFADVVWLFNNL